MPSLACRYYDPPGLWCQYCRKGDPARCLDRRTVPADWQPLLGRDQLNVPVTPDRKEAETGPLPWLLGSLACVTWGAALAYLTRGDWVLCGLALLLAVTATSCGVWSLARAAGANSEVRA